MYFVVPCFFARNVLYYTIPFFLCQHFFDIFLKNFFYSFFEQNKKLVISVFSSFLFVISLLILLFFVLSLLSAWYFFIIAFLFLFVNTFFDFFIYFFAIIFYSFLHFLSAYLY